MAHRKVNLPSAWLMRVAPVIRSLSDLELQSVLDRRHKHGLETQMQKLQVGISCTFVQANGEWASMRITESSLCVCDLCRSCPYRPPSRRVKGRCRSSR